MRSKRAGLPPWAAAGIALATLPSILVLLILWVLPTSNLTTGSDRLAFAMRGFTNMWFAGNTARTHLAALTDFNAYAKLMELAFGKGFPEHSWGYPPSMLLVASPFSMLPLLPAFLIWTALGIACFMSAMWAKHSTGSIPRGVAIACLFAPALWTCLLSGQTGAIAGALLITGMLAYPTSPVRGGIMLGLLSVKPQMGFLVPLHLLASGRWKALVWAGVSCIALIAASAFIWGIEGWTDFIGHTGGRMTDILQREWVGSSAQVNITSPFMAARALGSPLWLAWTLQGVVTAVCATACWKVSLRMKRQEHMGADARLVGVALVIALDLLSVPYSHDYDMPALAVATALLFRDGMMTGHIAVWERIVLAVAWTWPGMMVIVPVMFPSLAVFSPLLGATSLAGVALVGVKRLWLLELTKSDSTSGGAAVEYHTAAVEGERS